MIDLDHFKHINDTYGHDVGDMALLHTVKILRKLLHRKDHLIRHGGEEFLIFQYCGKGVDHRRHGIDLAEAILRAFRETPMHHPAYGEIHLRVSIGLYASSSGNEEFDQVLKKIDLALYRAKSAGRDCYMEVSGEKRRSDTVKFDNIKRYIEQNPLNAGMVRELGSYPFSSFRHFLKAGPMSGCLRDSWIVKRYRGDREAIRAFFESPVDHMGLREMRKASGLIEAPNVEKSPDPEKLAETLAKAEGTQERNRRILEAYESGYSQHLIAKVLGLNQSTVQRIIRRTKAKQKDGIGIT
jgi:diguanylate cyclase (GGDEF)-like protein